MHPKNSPLRRGKRKRLARRQARVEAACVRNLYWHRSHAYTLSFWPVKSQRFASAQEFIRANFALVQSTVTQKFNVLEMSNEFARLSDLVERYTLRNPLVFWRAVNLPRR